MLEVLGLVTLLIVVPVVVLAIIGGVGAWLEESVARDVDELAGDPDDVASVSDSTDGSTGESDVVDSDDE